MKRNFTDKEMEAIRHIRNWLMHKGRTPSIRELMAALSYKSPRSAALIVENLLSKKVLKKRRDGSLQLLEDPSPDSINTRTVDVPLVGTVACGLPILAEENIEGRIPVSVNLAKQGLKYFLLRASGDSMDESGINNGDLLLVRQQPTANNGDIVVALIDDEATVKEFHLAKGAVVLQPRSRNTQHRPIILTDEFRVQGVVVATIPKFKE